MELDLLFTRYVRRGDPAALAAVYDSVAPELLRLALHLARDAAEAEDLLQATFVTAIERADSFDPKRPVRPWLVGILGGHARNLARKQRMRAAEPVDVLAHRPGAERSPEHDARRAELEEALDTALSTLPPAFRPVVLLRVRHGLTAPEIADALERPAGTVRSQLARGLEAVRRALPVGLAGAFAAALQRPAAGLAAVRAHVLDHAAQHAAALAPAALFPVSLCVGGLAVKKLAALAVALVLTTGAWLATREPPLPLPPTPVPPPSAAPQSANPTLARPHTSVETAAGPERRSAPAPEPARSAAAAPDEVRETALVTVEVVEAGSGLPLATVPVTLEARGTTDTEPLVLALETGADGRARFDAIAPHYRWAQVSAGCAPLRAHALKPGPSTVRFELPAGTQAEGRVVDEHGAGVADASVWLSRANSVRRGRIVARTDAEGRFALAGIADDQWVAAKATGYALSPLQQVARGAGPRRPLEIALRARGMQLRGRVVSARGEAIADARVVVGPDLPTWIPVASDGTSLPVGAQQLARTDEDGAFRVDGLTPGPQVVRAFARGHAPARTEVHVEDAGPGRNPPLLVQLDEEATVAGVVRTSGGEPAPRVVVGWTSYAPEWEASAAVTDADGRYVLRGLPPGELRLSAQTQDGLRLEQSVWTSAGRTTTWDPSFAPPDRIAADEIGGVLVDEDGAPLASWAVLARPSGEAVSISRLSSTSTDASGRFRLRVEPTFGTFDLTVRTSEDLTGFARDERSAIAPGSPSWTWVVPRLERGHGTLTGRVLDDAGDAAHGVRIDVRDRARPRSASCDVREDGTFELTGVPAGEYDVDVRSRDLPWRNLGPHRVGAGEVVDLGTISLPRGGRLVARPSGAIEALVGEPNAIVSRVTGWSGRLQWEGDVLRSNTVEPGTVHLRLEAEGVLDVDRTCEVRAGEETVVDVPLVRAATREVTATLRSGLDRPPWMSFQVRSGSRLVCVRSAIADAEGRYAARLSVPKGTHTLRVVSADGVHEERTFLQATFDAEPPLELVLGAAR